MSESHDEATPADRPPEKGKTGEGEVAEREETGSEPEVEIGVNREVDTDSPGDVQLGPGGYAGRDPKSEMPRVPSVPETQDDSKGHDAAPPAEGKEPSASE